MYEPSPVNGFKLTEDVRLVPCISIDELQEEFEILISDIAAETTIQKSVEGNNLRLEFRSTESKNKKGVDINLIIDFIGDEGDLPQFDIFAPVIRATNEITGEEITTISYIDVVNKRRQIVPFNNLSRGYIRFELIS